MQSQRILVDTSQNHHSDPISQNSTSLPPLSHHSLINININEKESVLLCLFGSRMNENDSNDVYWCENARVTMDSGTEKGSSVHQWKRLTLPQDSEKPMARYLHSCVVRIKDSSVKNANNSRSPHRYDLLPPSESLHSTPSRGEETIHAASPSRTDSSTHHRRHLAHTPHSMGASSSSPMSPSQTGSLGASSHISSPSSHRQQTPQNVTIEVIIFGGIARGKIVNDLWKLSWESSEGIESARWVQIYPEDHHFLVPLSGHRAIYDDVYDAMFVFGGKTEKNTISNSLYEYSFRYNSWKRVQENKLVSAPGRQEHGLVLWNRSIIVFGGNDSTKRRIFNDLWRFDLETREWKQIVARNLNCVKPPESSCPAVELVRNRLYVYSGGSQRILRNRNNTSLSSLDCLFVYDFDENMWITVELKGHIPTPRIGHSLTMIREQFHAESHAIHPDLQSLYPCMLLFGGSSDRGEVNDMFELYDAEVVVQKQHDLCQVLHERDVHREELTQKTLDENAHLAAELKSLQEEKRAWINKEQVYKSHIAQMEENVAKMEGTIKSQCDTISQQKSQLHELTESVQQLEERNESLTEDNNQFAEQLEEAEVIIHRFQQEKEEHLSLLERQQDQITEIQTHSNNIIEQLKHQASHIGASHSQLVTELQVKRNEAVVLKDHVEQLIKNHQSTLGLMKDTYTAEIDQMKQLFDSHKSESASQHATYKNVINRLQAQADIDEFVYSETWKIPDSKLQIITKREGMLDEKIVDITSVSLSSKHGSRRAERNLLSNLYAQTRVNNKYILKTHGVVLSSDHEKAIIVREKTSHNLREFLVERSPLSIQERIAIIHQIVFGLKTLHRARVVLRSLHPDIIRFAVQGGKAIPKLCLHLCNSNSLPKTYMAPELRVGSNDIDSYKLDIFSLGMLIHFILTEKDPEWNILKGEFGAMSHSYPTFAHATFQTEEGKKLRALICRCHEMDASRRPPIDEVLKIVAKI